MMKMAIMGAGAIANKMAATITKMEKVEAYAIAARDKERAEVFAGQYGFARAYGSYAVSYTHLGMYLQSAETSMRQSFPVCGLRKCS